jgi:hypothetical protein
MHRRIAASATLLALLVVGLFPAAIAGAEPNFPPKDSRYHNYPEMVDEIMAAQSAYPDLVQISSIGKSYQGRDLWIARISDNVAVDEGEPEVLIDALHHSREHLGTEQALYLLKVLTLDYATDATVKRLVDSRVVWIIFALNPDGMEYDLTGNPYRAWRKNRQPNAGSTAVGTDLNRNYDYGWGCCRGSSGVKSSITYRGPRPFSAPETQAMRDFVRSRVINGRQRITFHITLHVNGQLILWPYGHTRTDIPADMTRADHSAFVALGKQMAARNGYKAEQSSDLYITDGDQIDWMYGRYRIFSFTWELYPPEHHRIADFYPPDERIYGAVSKNRSALLYAIDMAACPWAPAGYAKADCGPLYDDFEMNRGWVGNPDGTDTATAGMWRIGNPAQVDYLGHPMQLGTTTSGRYALVTGLGAASSTNANDLDGGTTTIRSAPVDLPATVGDLTFRYSFAHRANSSAADWFRVWVEAQDGTRTLVKEVLGTSRQVHAAWAAARIAMTPWAGQTVRIVIGAADGGSDTRVEAEVDDLRVERP